MIRHLLKLVWNRKRTNALVMAEILVSFLIVFVVVTMAVSLLSRWNTPLGFDWQNVWVIEFEDALPMEQSASHVAYNPTKEIDEAQRAATTADRLIREMKTLPEIEAAGADAMCPYSGNTWTTVLTIAGKHIDLTADMATDDFARAMKVPVVKGRWFGKEDDGQNYLPLVVDTDAARAMFGDAEPVGQKISTESLRIDDKTPRVFRIIGVIAPFRKDGELSDTKIRMIFMRATVVDPVPPSTRRLVARVRPGTPASFEVELNDRLRRLGTSSFTIQRMEDMRRHSIKERFAPVAVLAIIALFLISMVALGLTGVMWQTITRRMREIGLRRAVGASGSAVRRQVLGEVALLSTLSVIVGAAIIVQLPLLGLLRIVTPGEFTAGFVAALAVIYTITLTCGLYPSWLASSVQPAEALRYE